MLSSSAEETEGAFVWRRAHWPPISGRATGRWEHAGAPPPRVSSPHCSGTGTFSLLTPSLQETTALPISSGRT